MHFLDIPDEEKNGEANDYNDDYEDDFNPTRCVQLGNFYVLNSEKSYPECISDFYSPLCLSNSDMSIPEDIDEQLSISSFHSGSAKVCCFRVACKTFRMNQLSTNNLVHVISIMVINKEGW